jgi:hypothetical protein
MYASHTKIETVSLAKRNCATESRHGYWARLPVKRGSRFRASFSPANRSPGSIFFVPIGSPGFTALARAKGSNVFLLRRSEPQPALDGYARITLAHLKLDGTYSRP